MTGFGPLEDDVSLLSQSRFQTRMDPVFLNSQMLDDDGSLPEGNFIGFYATRNEMSEVFFLFLPHRFNGAKYAWPRL